MDTATPPTPGETTATADGLGARLKAFRARHPRLETGLFFMGGFCFDLLLLERIDSAPMLAHQGSYLALLAGLLVIDHHFTVAGTEPKGLWGRALHFRHEVIHFLFGTLLNAFLVFYFKASSGLWAFLFMLGLAALLVANELPRFRNQGPMMRVTLYSFALTSFFSYLFPVLVGFLSPWLFLLSAALSALVSFGLWRISARWTKDPTWTFRRAVVPGLAVQALLLSLYFLRVVPPVPLSLRWIGIYHDVRKEQGWALLHQRPAWRIWERGDQQYLARPGDVIHCFVRVFAPRKFKDGVKVRWAHLTPRGWQATDAIPLPITGGQEEGWVGTTRKQNYEPGQWRVSVETSDGREVGSLPFTVIDDPSTEPRTFHEDRG